jgi:antitoxin component of MazEF toxin-antitoxin module
METIATMTDRVLRFPRELLERAGLAATTQVKIRVHNGGLLIEPTEAAAQPRRSHPVMAAAGGWADRADLDNLVREIYAARASSTGRDVTL